MASPAVWAPSASISLPEIRRKLPLYLITGVAFAVLFSDPLRGLAFDWLNDPNAGHGLLLAPVALWLVWKSGVHPDARPSASLGIAVMASAVTLRFLSGIAAGEFGGRVSALLALAGLVVFAMGWRQVRAWWLPFLLLALSIPLPDVLMTTLSLPLQFKASAMGAALLEMRHIPVALSGNVINLPGHQLFVTEACSGLRSLTALISLGVLIGGLWLRLPVSRLLLIALTIPVGIIVNATRVFLTGFLVYFVSPASGEGFMHATEGWLLFLVAFGILGAFGWLLSFGEARLKGRQHA